MDPILRSSALSLKFANTGKLESLHSFIDEYKRVTSLFVDRLWLETEVPKLLPKEFTKPVQTWLSARAVQAAGKQASGIVRGTREKQKKRQFVHDELVRAGHFKKARKLKRKIDEAKISKPALDNVEPVLDSRFVTVEFGKPNSFDCWITLSSIAKRGPEHSRSILLPVRRTAHLNDLLSRANLKKGLVLSRRKAKLVFELPEPKPIETGETLGVDIGINSVISCSNGFEVTTDTHGHSLGSILAKLARKKKGSAAFGRAAEHRKNFINWSLNQLNLTEVKQIRCERIQGLRFGKHVSRYLSGFVYTEIFGKLGRLTEEAGVQLSRVNPAYTSQRCSRCGWTCKRNRNGKKFLCVVCGFAADADQNASRNISLELEPVWLKRQRPKDGFYWNLALAGKMHIVPSVLETSNGRHDSG